MEWRVNFVDVSKMIMSGLCNIGDDSHQQGRESNGAFLHSIIL